MTAPLDFDFALVSPLATRPPHAVPRAEMLAEVEQELADRRGFYPRLVRGGKMDEADAARHIALLQAVRDDLALMEGAFTWDAKIRELRRELALRRNAWPKRLAKPGGPLDPATAARRLERLDAVHFLYWIELFASDDQYLGRPMLPPPHVVPSDATTSGLVRAHIWRVWQWERAAGGAADPAARPWMAEFYARIDAGDADALWDWNHYRSCAERMGFVEIEQAA